MQFRDVIGQRPTKELFIQLAKEQRVPHAILLVGPPGNGKLGMALAFAQYLNCRDKTENDSCGICSSCLKFKKLIHPDLHFTIPVIKTSAISKPTSSDYLSKWRSYFLANPYPIYERWNQIIAEENKQGMIYVDEAAEIIQKLNRKSYEADDKVSLIWLPVTMHLTCANKILKVLEEPPVNVVFILATTEAHKVPATIVSRCQRFDFKKISADVMAERLKKITKLEKKSVDDEVIDQIVGLSQGCERDAESLLGQVLSLDDKKITIERASLVLPRSNTLRVKELAQLVAKKQVAGALAIIDCLLEEGVDIETFTNDFLDYLHSAMLLKSGAGNVLNITAGEMKELEAFTALVDIDTVLKIIDTVMRAQQEGKWSSIPQLPLEIAIVKSCEASL